MVKTVSYHNNIGLKWQLHNDVISHNMQFYQKENDVGFWCKNIQKKLGGGVDTVGDSMIKGLI